MLKLILPPGRKGANLPIGPSREQLRAEAAIFELETLVKIDDLYYKAWEHTIQPFLDSREQDFQERHRQFNRSDYSEHIDAQSSLTGLESFLASRAKYSPQGILISADDKKDLIATKNRIFASLLETATLDVYNEAIDQIKELRSNGVKVAVSSASDQAKEILEKIGLINSPENPDLIQQIACGDSLEEAFNSACSALGVHPAKTVLICESIPAVKSASKTNLGAIIALESNVSRSELLHSGADIILSDPSEASMDRIHQAIQDKVWTLKYTGYAIDKMERMKEAAPNDHRQWLYGFKRIST